MDSSLMIKKMEIIILKKDCTVNYIRVLNFFLDKLKKNSRRDVMMYANIAGIAVEVETCLLFLTIYSGVSSLNDNNNRPNDAFLIDRKQKTSFGP